MTNHKQERAQKIMNAFTADWQDEPIEQDKKCLANALRAMADSFVYDDNGLVWVTANDFYEIAQDLEAL